MAYTDINTEDRLVQATFAEQLERELGWESVYAWNDETFGANSKLGQNDAREVMHTRDLSRAIQRSNPNLPQAALEAAIDKLGNALVYRTYSQHWAIFRPHRYGERTKVPNRAKPSRIKWLWRNFGDAKNRKIALSLCAEGTCECDKKA